MKKFFVLLLATLCVIGAVAQTTPANEVANTATFKVGDTLTYHFYNSIEDAKSGSKKKFGGPMTAKEVRENGDIYFHVNNNPNNYRVYDRNGNMLARKTPTGVEQEIRFTKPEFSYPMKIGEKYSVAYTFTPLNPDSNRRLFSCTSQGKAVGWESVTVPAGTFMALRIEIEGFCNISPSGWVNKVKKQIWVSSETKMFPILSHQNWTWDGGYEETIYSLSTLDMM